MLNIIGGNCIFIQSSLMNSNNKQHLFHYFL